MTDEQLVESIKAGNRDHFNELYSRYLDPIFSFVFFRVSHRETAEDITSTIFLKVLDRLYQFSNGSFRGWLYTIARTTVIDHYRTRRPTVDIEAHDVRVSEDQDLRVDRRIALEKVRRAIQDLPEDQREVVLLRVWDDLPYAEISAQLGTTEAAAKMSFSRSVHRLRTILTVLSLAILTTYFYVINI